MHCSCLAVHYFTVQLVFRSFKISKPQRQRQRVQWKCTRALQFFARFFAILFKIYNINKNVKYHGQFVQFLFRILTLSYTFLFKISKKVLDKMNECDKFSRDSWVEYKAAFLRTFFALLSMLFKLAFVVWATSVCTFDHPFVLLRCMCLGVCLLCTRLTSQNLQLIRCK